jgi:putative transposase
MIAELQTTEPRHSIRRLCQLTGTGRTWYYQHPSAEERARRDVALRDAIEQIVLEFPGYGYRRVTAQLQRDEWVVNHKRVLRIMRTESLLCHLKKHFVATTDSTHGHRRYPNLIKERLIERLDQVWVADMTYIHLPTAFAYLAAVLDAYSRRCIGWQLSRTIDTQLTLAALEQALVRRQPMPGVIHHSDQGVQYASQGYVTRLETAGLQLSMAAVGNPYENARAESFFKTLKREEVYLNDYQSFAEAEAHLDQFIATVYNQKRLHSSLGYRPPVEFEMLVGTSCQPSL